MSRSAQLILERFQNETIRSRKLQRKRKAFRGYNLGDGYYCWQASLESGLCTGYIQWRIYAHSNKVSGKTLKRHDSFSRACALCNRTITRPFPCWNETYRYVIVEFQKHFTMPRQMDPGAAKII